MAELSHIERTRLEEALMGAFPHPDELEMMMLLRLDRRLGQIVSLEKSYKVIVFRLLDKAEAEGWSRDLLAAACAERPGNEQLAKVAEPLLLVPALSAELEQIVNTRLEFQDVATWRAELWRTEGRVCRIESPIGRSTESRGTGFLVAPGLVLTNHHVVAHIIKRDDAGETKVRFDHKRDDSGGIVTAGVVYGLAEDWLVCASPPGAADAAGEDPGPDELDFALLRLDTEAGRLPAGLAANSAGLEQRGWVELNSDSPEPQAGDLAIILQHPQERPMQLAIDTVLDVNSAGTRVRYLTNTAPGSSGSPCFTLDWHLIALHQGSGISADGAAHNRGIPISAIRRYVATHGLADQLITE